MRRHLDTFSRQGDLEPEICAAPVPQCLKQGVAQYTNLYTTDKNIFRRSSYVTAQLMEADVIESNGSKCSPKYALSLYTLPPLNMYYHYYHDLRARSAALTLVLLQVEVLTELLDPKRKGTTIPRIRIQGFHLG
jgi:hypothetical protein